MLIIHIGTHKTGTSSLQSLLAARKEALLAQGVRYIEAGRPGRMAHHMLAWAIRGRRNTKLTIWDGVRDEIGRSREKINILSTEGFWFEDPAEIRKNLGYDGAVKVVAYLRRQDKFLQSLYKQTVSSGRKTDFETWLRDVPHRGDYLPVIEKWARVFGDDAITIRPYERDEKPVDVVVDFLDVLGLDAAPLLKDRKYPQNPSPRRELLHFLRAFNQLNLKIDYEKFFYSIIQRNKAYVRSADLLTYEQRCVLMREYAEGNRVLAERYWRGGGALFPALVPSELPPMWTLGDPEFFALTVDVMDAIVKFVSGGVELRKKKRENAKAP